MYTHYGLYKIKPGKRQQWLDWCARICELEEEAEETLREEFLLQEMCVLFGEGDETYVMYKHVPVVGKKKLPANMERALNVEHFKNFNECLEVIKPRVFGYHIIT